MKRKSIIVNHPNFVNALFNIGRNFINPLFIAFTTYFFIQAGETEDLRLINSVMALYSLALVFSGWGLKDYLIKESANTYSHFQQKWNLALYSKLFLIIPPIGLVLIGLKSEYAVFVIWIVVLKAINLSYDPLIIHHRRSAIFFVVDLIIALSMLFLIGTGIIKGYELFFYWVITFEGVRIVFNYLIFKQPTWGIPSVRGLFHFLISTKYYFLLGLFGFFQSKVDLYLLGFLFEPQKLNEYQLLLSLIALSQIAIASFVMPYSKLMFRNIYDTNKTFKDIIYTTSLIMAICSSVCIYLILNFTYSLNFTYLNTALVFLNLLSFGLVLYEMYQYTKLIWLKKILTFVFMSGAINLFAGLLLIPRYSVTGGILSNTLGLFCLYLLMHVFRRNSHKVEPI